MSEIADLFATLGMRVKQSEFNEGDRAIRRAQRMAEQAAKKRAADEAHAAKVILQTQRAAQREADRVAQQALRANEKLAKDKEKAEEKAAARRKELLQRTERQAQGLTLILAGVGTYLAQRFVRSGIEFNATMEDSKNNVAGMLALANKSHLADELQNANMLVDNLHERAMKLPGTTMDYVQMLSMITQPITDAKLGLQDLEDMTVSAVVAARGLHIPWEVAARDIEQALRGQYGVRDIFSSKVLGSIGYKGEEGRAKYLALSDQDRAKEFRRGLAQPQFAELGVAAGKSFSGVLSTLQDTWQNFQGMVTKPLFERLTAGIKELNDWMEKNDATVREYAATIGDTLVTAFESIVGLFKWLADHGDVVIAIFTAIAALMTAIAIKFLISFGLLGLIIAAVALVAYGIIMLVKHWDAVKAAARRTWEAIKDGFSAAFQAIAELPIIAELLAVASAAARLIGMGKRTPEQQAVVDRAAVAAGMPRLKRDEELTDQERRFVSSGVMRRPETRAPLPSNITVGKVDVNVNAPNADPSAVAQAVGKHFDEKMGNMLRETHDVVAP